MKLNKRWPVLKSYDTDHLARIALPLGGIGTGCVSLGGRGDLRDWEIVNSPSKGFSPRHTFFALYTRESNGLRSSKLIEGPLDPPYDTEAGFRGRWYGMPRFRSAEFHAAYPFGQVVLSDDSMPVDVRIDAYNPLVPGDLEASGLPVAVLRFVLSNKTDGEVVASVCGNMNNFIGTDGVEGSPDGNVNEYRSGGSATGVFMSSKGVPDSSERWGTMALATTACAGVTYRTGWFDSGLLFESLAEYWRDFSNDGTVTSREDGGVNDPMASVAVRLTVPPRRDASVTFVISWWFPNRTSWTAASSGDDSEIIGNYYTTRFGSAWDAAEYFVTNQESLEARTAEFARSFCDSDLPAVVKEAALFNTSTLRTQTCFRTRDGTFFGWEGCNDTRGCCPGSCTHVWNYEQTTPFLFGELSRMMRNVEFSHMTREDGHMSFRVFLPLERAREHGIAAADGQMGCLMKLYRDWQLSGDDEMLQELWPKAKKALEFAWIPGGWDADRDGVMEGTQHNTTDLEFYGPNPLMACWYLGALRAVEEMAKHLGENEYAHACRAVFDRGSRWVDEQLFNGEYYEHHVSTPAGADGIASGLRGHAYMKDESVSDPPQQPEKGCMTDQLAGQFMAHVCGLGHLLDSEHILLTLQSIMKHNFLTDLYDHANPVRAFSLQDEQMLVYGTYPHDDVPQRPCFRFFENWTGVEYAAAVLMMQEGLLEEGLRVYQAVRDRFDGRKRNPFDEPECGHHYARAMASWAGVLALTGFSYSAVTGTIRFSATPQPSRFFWSNGTAWGIFYQEGLRDGTSVRLEVRQGRLEIERVVLSRYGEYLLPSRSIIEREEPLVLFIEPGNPSSSG